MVQVLLSSLSFQRRSYLCRIILMMMMMITIHITTTTNPSCCISNAFTLPALLQYPSSSSSSSLLQLKQQQLEQSYESDKSRRHNTLLHRRMMIQQQLHLLPILIISVPTIAAAAKSSSKDEQDNEELLNTQIHEAFMKLQNELNVNNNNSNGGGIYILQQYIQNENYNNILEYTKTYDPKLRKGIMKPIQQLLIQKVNMKYNNNNNNNDDDNKAIKEQTIKYIQTQTTTYMNAITFDLIGINRNARSQQINNIQLQKYLYELQQDIQSFLQLEHIV